MSLAKHISTLEDKHYRLETMIEDESARPMPDFTVVQALKRQKLLIKEELGRMLETQSESSGVI